MIDPRISMGATVPNLQTSMQLFQNTLNNIQNRKANAQVMAQDEQMNPLRLREAEQAVEANQLSLDENRQNEIIRSVAEFAPTLKPLLENGDYVGSLQALQVRKQDLQSRGVDTAITDEAIQEIMNGNPDNVLQSLNVAESEAANRGLIGGAGGLTAGQKERKSLLRDAKSDDPIVRDSALRELGALERAGTITANERAAKDQELTKSLEKSQAQIEGGKARGRTEQTSLANREQAAVDVGLESADAIGTITRAIDLLKEIETGGAASVKLRAKQFFGVEGADEGELSNALGKAVLSQLKTIFGSAFTEGEGARLERIEASFSKSNATNLRLLERELESLERKARRGLSIAEKTGDDFTAGEIRKSLELLSGLSGDPAPSEEAKPRVIKFDSQGNIIQ